MATTQKEKARWYHRAGIWIGIGINPASITLGGGLASRLPLTDLVWVFPLGAVLLVGTTAMAALVGQKYEAPLAKWASNTFGLGVGMLLINLLMAVGMGGWNGFQLGLMGKAASNLGRVPPYFGVLIIAIALFTLFSLGVNRWNWFVWLTTLSSLSVALVCVVVVRTLAQNPETITTPDPVGFTTILWAIGTIMAYAALFSLRSPDFSWDLASQRDVWADAACFLTALLISGTIGIALYRTTGQWDLSEILADTNLALLGQAFLIISLIGPALSTIYSGGLAWTNVLPLKNAHVGTALILAVGIVLGITRFDLRMLPFLDWIGTVTPVALLVMILTQLTPIKSTHRNHLIALLIGSVIAIVTKLSGSQLHLWTGITSSLLTLLVLKSPYAD